MLCQQYSQRVGRVRTRGSVRRARGLRTPERCAPARGARARRGHAEASPSEAVPVEESVDDFEQTERPATELGIEEVFHYNFQEKVGGVSADKLVVVDFFTDKCGPCKLIYPKVCELADEYNDEVAFYRLNCNRCAWAPIRSKIFYIRFIKTEHSTRHRYNKPLAKELEIRSVPTFKVFRDGECVDTMTGARIDELREMIENHRSATAAS